MASVRQVIFGAALALGLAGAVMAEPSDTLARKAFEDAQMATSSKAAVAFAQSAARLAAKEPGLADLIRKRQDAEVRWRALDEQLATARAGSSPAARAKTAELDALSNQTRAEIAAQDTEIEQRFPEFYTLVSPAPATAADIQAELGADEALVLIVPAFDGTYLWAVTRERVVWRRGEIYDEDVDKAVASLRRALDPAGAVRAAVDASGEATQGARLNAFPRAEAYALYQKIWAPIADAVGSAKTVYVVATGSLSALPLSVLPTAAPKGEDTDPAALRATPWLFTKHALATLPSPASLKLVRRLEAGGRGGVAFAGFGDPALDGDPTGAVRGLDAYQNGGRADAAALKGLPRLPGTRTELDALARALKAPRSSVVAGAAATETAVRGADLARTRVVAFATHGLLAGELDGITEPALVFTPPSVGTEADDGLLTASEAAGLKLDADFVILSACNTAAGDGRSGGEGLSGLARAFFHAGARALLVSHWRVRDDAAARLTALTVQGYERHPRDGRARALQQAMLTVMNDRRDPGFAQPAVWAPFVLAGEAR
jgi:CHAT domain-containing protein